MPTTRPTSSAIAKSCSESPPRTTSAARMNIEPRPVLTVRGIVSTAARLAIVDEVLLGLGAPPAFADAVEDDDGVVDRQTDDRHRGGQEDAVDRLLQPGEEAHHEDHVVRHREHRGDTEGPLEADREVEQLGQERDTEGDERVVAQLLAERGADRLVVDPWSTVPPTSARAVLDPLLLVVGDLAGADGEVGGVGGLHDGLGEAGVGDGLARLVDRDVLADRVVELATAGELDAEVEALGDDAGDGDARAPRPRCPATSCDASSDVGSLRSSHARTLPMVAQAADGGTALDRLVGHARGRRARGR